MFVGEGFIYRKYKLCSLFISQDLNMWKLVCDGYVPPKGPGGKKM